MKARGAPRASCRGLEQRRAHGGRLVAHGRDVLPRRASQQGSSAVRGRQPAGWFRGPSWPCPGPRAAPSCRARCFGTSPTRCSATRPSPARREQSRHAPGTASAVRLALLVKSSRMVELTLEMTSAPSPTRYSTTFHRLCFAASMTAVWPYCTAVRETRVLRPCAHRAPAARAPRAHSRVWRH
jgi:hypothetical protein